MTAREFYNWGTKGGANDVVRLVEAHPQLRVNLPRALREQLED